ncbi:MAG: hypothetical protein N2560_02530 [Ignavibacteria bacterium]|nr:hypothetical protein [Ignavibacteria bacterium]
MFLFEKICNHKIIVFILVFALFACQEGLDPTLQKEESFIKGKVIVISGKNSWPPPDSAVELRVVGFKEYPPKDLINEIVSGNAFISESLERFKDTIGFELKIEKPPVEIKYLVAALRYGSILEWKAIGVFSDEMTYERTPKKIIVTKGRVIENVNILVDFYNLPKQPF